MTWFEALTSEFSISKTHTFTLEISDRKKWMEREL
jgi:hypothetical protein